MIRKIGKSIGYDRESFLNDMEKIAEQINQEDEMSDQKLEPVGATLSKIVAREIEFNGEGERMKPQTTYEAARARALDLILSELGKAEEKHPEWPEDMIHAAAVVAEKSGELVQASLDHHYFKGNPAAMRREAAQVGAVAIRFLIGSTPILKTETFIPTKFQDGGLFAVRVNLDGSVDETLFHFSAAELDEMEADVEPLERGTPMGGRLTFTRTKPHKPEASPR